MSQLYWSAVHRDGRETRTYDCPVDVTAGGDGVEHALVDLLDRRLQVRLDDSVELERLTSRELECVVAALVGNLVNGEPLVRLADTGRQTQPNHERVGGFEAVRLALVPDVAVVLLVDAVELGELTVRLGERARRRVLETLDDGSAEVV